MQGHCLDFDQHLAANVFSYYCYVTDVNVDRFH